MLQQKRRGFEMSRTMSTCGRCKQSLSMPICTLRTPLVNTQVKEVTMASPKVPKSRDLESSIPRLLYNARDDSIKARIQLGQDSTSLASSAEESKPPERSTSQLCMAWGCASVVWVNPSRSLAGACADSAT